MMYISCTGYRDGRTVRFYGWFKNEERMFAFANKKYPEIRIEGYQVHEKDDPTLRNFFKQHMH